MCVGTSVAASVGGWLLLILGGGLFRLVEQPHLLPFLDAQLLAGTAEESALDLGQLVVDDLQLNGQLSNLDGQLVGLDG